MNMYSYVVACSYHYFVTDSGVTIGAVVGGILLLIIIALLLLIIIILLYENKSSKGRLDITSTSVAYKAANLDLGASDNVVIKPNPTYHPIKQESSVYSQGMELEPADDEIGEGSLIMRNPTFFTEDKSNEYDYVISVNDLLATVN